MLRSHAALMLTVTQRHTLYFPSTENANNKFPG